MMETQLSKKSKAHCLASLPPDEQRAILATLSESELKALLYTWQFWARPNQLPPEAAWTIWLILAGRGFGKTRTGAETVRDRVENNVSGRIALIAPTAADARDVMVEGESGILAISPPWFRPVYEPSKRRLTWPNGAVATTYSADEPERLRGPQHDFGWLDELCAWRYIQQAFDMFLFGLRLGKNPQVVITTTPKPVAMLRQIRKDPGTIETTGSTYENSANLAPTFLNTIVRKYAGTRLGDQELLGIELTDTPGALWNATRLEFLRVGLVQIPTLVKIVVSVDPSVSDGENAAETGIIVAGRGINGHFYVLDDFSMQGSPEEWASVVVKVFKQYQADSIIVEINNGGLMCASVIRAVEGGENLPIRMVRASRGKYARAEPVAAMYEQGRGHHLGHLMLLEAQMCNWVPNSGEQSPDRLDAMVWGAAGLYEEIFEEVTKPIAKNTKQSNYLTKDDDD